MTLLLIFKVRLDCLLMTLIYRTIHSHENHVILQQDLNTLTKWADRWKMMFNVSKCSIMQLSTALHKSAFVYTMNDNPLSLVTEHRYLEILINDKLSWHPHINQLCHKANHLLWFLQRNLLGCSRTLKDNSFTYNRILFSYLGPTPSECHPPTQHRVARFVLNKPWCRNDRDSVSQMLMDLNWPSLQDRRKHSCLLLLYKVVTNHFKVPLNYLPCQAYSNT